MLTPSSFLRLSFSPDLIQGGIAYAVRSLPYTYNRMGGSPYDRLRRIAAGVAVELAFRRYLAHHDIPYDLQGWTPFTQPDRYDLSLGGHRCDLKSFLITRRAQIRRIRRDPSLLLDAPALVPVDQDAAEGRRDDDLYLFAFVAALVAASRRDMQRAQAAGQPLYLLHALSKPWANPYLWAPLGPLALKSDCETSMVVEIGGQLEDRSYATETVHLPPRTRVEAGTPFFSITSLHVDRLPSGRIALRSPLRSQTYVIAPYEWGNIWIYGMDIFLTGWILRREFRLRARVIPAGMRVFQYDRTQVKNLAVDVRRLHSLHDLFERVKEWEANKKARKRAFQ